MDNLRAINLKKLTDLVVKQVVKNTKFDKLNTKVNSLGNKISYTTILIHLSQYNTDKQNLKTKVGDFDRKIPDLSGLVTTALLNTKIKEVKIRNSRY